MTLDCLRRKITELRLEIAFSTYGQKFELLSTITPKILYDWLIVNHIVIVYLIIINIKQPGAL